jgi:hypothetical protein
MSELKRLLEAAGISGVVLADKAGVSRFRLWQAEAGLRELTPAEQSAIERILDPALVETVRVIDKYTWRERMQVAQ